MEPNEGDTVNSSSVSTPKNTHPKACDKPKTVVGPETWMSEEFDPGERLSFEKQVKYDTELATSTLTPFDFTEYVQAFCNPKAMTTQQITVQVVHPNVTNVNTTIPEKDLANPMTCTLNHPLKLVEELQKNISYCEVCLADKQKHKFYHCEECRYDICFECQA